MPSPLSASERMLDEVVGNYRIVRKIGEGGMGAVYLGEHALIGRPAAIKVLLREMSHRQDLVTRFFNEARAATAVKHPGIVEIYDFGYHSDGSAYIVMEYLEGESLSARLRRTGPCSETRAAALCRQVAGALAAAHAKGIVHRDLKPDNIFVVRDADVADGERTKVLDFGIAKLTGAEEAGSGMTRTGMVLGTPAYMSPEQCKGAGTVDQRADLYALGCILYEMVCGRVPFVAEGAGELMALHIFAPVPPPSTIRPVTPQLEQLLLRALAKEPEHRFASAEEMIAALRVAVPSGSFPRAGAAEATVMIGAGAGPYHPTPPPPASIATFPPRPTTLQGAVGASATASATAVTPAPRRRRAWLVAAATIAIGAGGAFAVTSAVTGGRSQGVGATTPPAVPAPAPAPKPAPAPVAAHPVITPLSTPPPPPAKITIALRSDPGGADVYRMPQGVRIGTTPLDYAMDPIDGEIVLIVKKRGYDDQQLAVRADRDHAQAVTLVRHAFGGPTRPGGGHPSAPTPPAGTLDPFDKLGAKP
jgi:eukaryotic-like serine/threonine-protein kinase